VPAKLILYPPQRAPRFLVLRDGETLDVGRDPACGLVVEDPRVSKRHARLRWTDGGWTLEDLGSKNGTLVNAERADGRRLGDGDTLSLGGLPARFETLTAEEAATLEQERLASLKSSQDMRRRLGAAVEPVDLLLCFLELAREVTRTERGFVVVAGPESRLRVEVAAGFTAEEVGHDRFRGSVGAVKQALESEAPVVIADVPADPRLGRRPSVMALGIGAVVCVPLRHEGKTLGVIYVDSRKSTPAFTAVDIEILEALAARAALVLAGALSARKIPQVLTAGERGLITRLQQRLDELLPAM
jgi:pSer/pThr/pTyr-binding forkhead associated (FHA) protein/putative methionine-R-sulfoxide reductase with GAF domain